MSIFFGLDLGKRNDRSALVGVEQLRIPVGGINRVTYEQPREMRLDVRLAERARLGTSYLDVAERVREVVQSRRVAGRCTLVPDATGVGVAVLELLRPEQLGCEVVPVTITAGERATVVAGGWRVPKRELMMGLMVSLQKRQLRIAAKLPEARTLVEELIRMRATISDGGHAQFGASAGAHDDLVLALALAVWRARRSEGKSMWGTRDLGLW